jgi:hypothetical protein
MIPCRHHALAVALIGLFAAPVSATEYPFGILVEGGSALMLERGDVVSVSGPATGRAITIASRGSLEAIGIAIENRTRGNAAGYAYGLLAFDGSDFSMLDGSLTMRGDRSVGAQVQGRSRAVFQDVDLAVAGADSIGITARADSLIALNRTTLRIDGTNSRGLVAQGEGAGIVGRADIDHAGATSGQGLTQAAAVSDGGTISLSDSSIVSRQPGVAAVSIDGVASSFVMSRGVVAADGERAVALSGSGGNAVLSGTALRGRGAAISTRLSGAGTLHVDILEGSRVVGGIETGQASLAVSAQDSELLGDIRRSGAGALDVTLRHSQWAGRADAADSVALDGATWQVTGDSGVGRLTLAGGAHVAFDGAVGLGQLRLGQLQNLDNEGVIDLRTRLDGGGTLARQATDRLLVDGDVSGITTLRVIAAGGDGGATAPGPGGGISLAQVGGAATADSFRLAGHYVAVGPWRYGLRAYAPGNADASQRLVDGTGADYWDYRLQSTRVDAQGDAYDGLGQQADGVTSRHSTSRTALVPQVPTYLVLAGALFGYGRTAMDAMQMDALGASRDVAVRARVFGGGAGYRSTLPFARFGFGYTRSDRGLQVGADMLSAESDATRMRSGVVASVGTSRVTPRAVDGTSHARATSRGMALTYAISSDAGWHVDAAYGFAQHRIGVRTAARGEVLARLRASGRDASLGGGFRWSPRTHVAIDPGASLLWQRLRFASATDGDGIAVRMRAPERTTLRAGARASLAFEPHGGRLNAWTAYIDARYAASRDSGASAELSRVHFATGHGGRGVDLAAGGSVELRSDITLFADVNRRMRMGGSGESGLAARLGAAMTF